MTVAELISFLQTQPQDLQVAYEFYNGHCLLEVTEIKIAELCGSQTSGWVYHKTPGNPTQTYLLLPGNC